MTPKRGDKPHILGIEDTSYLGVGAHRVEAVVPGLDGWEVGLMVPLWGEDAYTIVELTIRPAFDSDSGRRPVPRGGVRAATLRALPLVAILRAAYEPGPHLSVGWFNNYEFPEESSEIVREAKGGRPRIYDDVFYAQVAVDWARLTAQGRGALGRFATERMVPQSTAKNWVTAATEREFLHRPKKRGPSARGATKKARDVLQRSESEESEP